MAPTGFPTGNSHLDALVLSSQVIGRRLNSQHFDGQIGPHGEYQLICQWPFQDPIHWRYLPYIRPIFQAYVREYTHKIWPYMVQYLQFRFLKWPLNMAMDQNLKTLGTWGTTDLSLVLVYLVLTWFNHLHHIISSNCWGIPFWLIPIWMCFKSWRYPKMDGWFIVEIQL